MDYIHLFDDVIFLTSLTSTGVALLFSFFARQPGYIKPICLIVLFSFSADLLNAIGAYLLNVYIPYVRSTYRILELILILEFYNIIFSSKWNTYLVRVLQIGLPVFLFFVITYETRAIRITNSILFSIYALFYFRKLIMAMKMGNPLDFPVFWINAAILLYFSGSLFIFLFFDPLAKLHELSAIGIYIFHNIFLIAKNVLFAIGFWKVRKLDTSQLTA